MIEDPKFKPVYANAADPGLRFILPSLISDEFGGLMRDEREGHLGTIVGRGGSGKSILALQLVTDLLNRRDDLDTERDPKRPNAAFYFTLEASPIELARQVRQFSWGWDRYRNWYSFGYQDRTPRVLGDDQYSSGLYLLSIPSPTESLNALNLKIRQTISQQLGQIKHLDAIVIDPMGAVNAGTDLRTDLNELKQLAESHRTFLFLLTEKYAFEAHASIEHYSQSIIHLEHDPSQQHHRRLFIQKARGQGFRSGYHNFELQQPRSFEEGDTTELRTAGMSENDRTKVEADDRSKGIRVFPSVEAQSAYAHEQLFQKRRHTPERADENFFPDEETGKQFLEGERIQAGSAVFLMGPPGTLKEFVVSQFAAAAVPNQGATLYLSFKADIHAGAVPLDPKKGINKPISADTYFYDARSPLLTPEEILFAVQNAITRPAPEKDGPPPKQELSSVTFQRAIVWGLRRLYDFPNFREGRAVQFLEALVTLLKSRQITSLLVDWPDKQTLSTVPIVDLCQYIFLTRVCLTEEERKGMEKPPEPDGLTPLWDGDVRRVALLRAQRTRKGVHHNQGAVLRQIGTEYEWKPKKELQKSFEYLWLKYGRKWEEDLSLLS